jgi:hypothetical protein
MLCDLLQSFVQSTKFLIERERDLIVMFCPTRGSVAYN